MLKTVSYIERNGDLFRDTDMPTPGIDNDVDLFGLATENIQESCVR